MPAIQFEIEVQMEGGEQFTVVADQRDLARYEVQPFYSLARRMTMMRFLGWSASYRQGRTKLPWEKFDEQCVEAGDPAEEDTVLDPTQPVHTGENSSTSQQ